MGDKMTKKEPEVIRFQAQLSGIRTVIDGGSSVTFSLSGKEVKALTQLLQVRQQVGVILEVAAVPVMAKLENKINVKEKSAPRRNWNERRILRGWTISAQL